MHGLQRWAGSSESGPATLEIGKLPRCPVAAGNKRQCPGGFRNDEPLGARPGAAETSDQLRLCCFVTAGPTPHAGTILTNLELIRCVCSAAQADSSLLPVLPVATTLPTCAPNQPESAICTGKQTSNASPR